MKTGKKNAKFVRFQEPVTKKLNILSLYSILEIHLMMAEDKIPATVEHCIEKPKFWDNDEKIDSWFTPFRSRELNPLNYDNKMNYWKSNVDFFCSKTKKCILSLQDVASFFLRNGKTPMCLSTVFEAMQRFEHFQDM